MQYQPRPVDMRAARYLMGWTVAEAAARSGVCEATLVSAERGVTRARSSVLPSTFADIVTVYRIAGVVFMADGLVRHDHHGRAPTEEAVGMMTGARMMNARYGLKAKPYLIAMRAGVATHQVKAIEKLPFPGQRGISTAVFYRVFNALEAGGHFFGRRADLDIRAVRQPAA